MLPTSQDYVNSARSRTSVPPDDRMYPATDGIRSKQAQSKCTFRIIEVAPGESSFTDLTLFVLFQTRLKTIFYYLTIAVD